MTVEPGGFARYALKKVCLGAITKQVMGNDKKENTAILYIIDF